MASVHQCAQRQRARSEARRHIKSESLCSTSTQATECSKDIWPCQPARPRAHSGAPARKSLAGSVILMVQTPPEEPRTDWTKSKPPSRGRYYSVAIAPTPTPAPPERKRATGLAAAAAALLTRRDPPLQRRGSDQRLPRCRQECPGSKSSRTWGTCPNTGIGMDTSRRRASSRRSMSSTTASRTSIARRPQARALRPAKTPFRTSKCRTSKR
mmetsp:Transcript_133580/g.427186  ORF Transcript_133580/g.427186 Transcript_133580/m.427186 type:complete len:212 (+) Transcript_133580:77-712(+)